MGSILFQNIFQEGSTGIRDLIIFEFSVPKNRVSKIRRNPRKSAFQQKLHLKNDCFISQFLKLSVELEKIEYSIFEFFLKIKRICRILTQIFFKRKEKCIIHFYFSLTQQVNIL